VRLPRTGDGSVERFGAFALVLMTVGILARTVVRKRK
jgi:hypothetical protein